MQLEGVGDLDMASCACAWIGEETARTYVGAMAQIVPMGCWQRAQTAVGGSLVQAALHAPTVQLGPCQG